VFAYGVSNFFLKLCSLGFEQTTPSFLSNKEEKYQDHIL